MLIYRLNLIIILLGKMINVNTPDALSNIPIKKLKLQQNLQSVNESIEEHYKFFDLKHGSD